MATLTKKKSLPVKPIAASKGHVEVVITCDLPEGSRRVTNADLTTAATAAAAAFRATLEGKAPAYELDNLERRVRYTYELLNHVATV